MIRCRTCLIPNTRPDTAFDETGQCSACQSFAKRKQIDWTQRESELLHILETAPRNGSGFDCIVPSSGGKDSTWQTLKLIELGVRPLVVTASTCMLTDIGRRNIDNLARYATTIEVTPNRTVRAKLNRIGLETVGDISWPEHMAIFSIPFRVAADLGIPLIFFGECPQEAYGGPLGAEEARTMTARWVSEYGGLLGLRADDMVDQDGITAADMADYRLPSDEKMRGLTAYFLGQFYEWDSHRNARVAREHGMTCRLPYEGNWWDFENLDCSLTGAHDFFCYLKYGFGRCSAQLSVDIRRGLIPRAEALEIARQRDGLYPYTYCGVDLIDILDHIGLGPNQFQMICDRFTNQALFAGYEGGRPVLKEFIETEQAA